jgi:hypothetical protein
MLPNMTRNLLLAAVGGALLATGAGQSRAPVLVELFTSEGCSSCPPADRLLELLDPQAIVLSEHVDYWDRLGWRDPYSSRAATQRQEAYARRFGLDGPYTPEMVVDGQVEFNGSDERRAAGEIARAGNREKASVRLRRTAAGLQVDVDAAPGNAGVFLAIAENSGTSQVSAGENKGRRLHHVAIVRGLRKIGSVKRGSGFSQAVELGPDTAAVRLVVFLQDAGMGRVYGAAILP